MKIYRYWARSQGKSPRGRDASGFTALGYSNQSVEDALRVAEERANRIADRLADASDPWAHYYPESPIREEIIEEFTDSGGRTIGIVTRNSYGCLVLNTPDVFFADVDQDGSERPQSPPATGASGVLSALRGLFGKSNVLDQIESAVAQAGLGGSSPPHGSGLAETLESLVNRDRSLRLRLYRTSKGFRVMITSRRIDATSSNARTLLNDMGADRLYASLCRSQDCYRARLTPKPWRIGLAKPSGRFPFTAESRSRFDAWVVRYEHKAAGFSTCHLIGEFGNAPMDPVAKQIAELHDHFAIQGDLPLA